MNKQLSNCCKAPINFNEKLDRPECYTCIECGRVIGTDLKTNTKDTNSQDSIHSTEEANQNVDSTIEEMVEELFANLSLEHSDNDGETCQSLFNKEGRYNGVGEMRECDCHVLGDKKVLEQALTQAREQGYTRGRIDEAKTCEGCSVEKLNKAKEQGAREEREKLSRFVGMRYPKTDETKELIAEIIKALKPQK